MILLIDNFDSFSSTLESYLATLGADVCVVRCDKVDVGFVERVAASGQLEGIVISPGPKAPADYPDEQKIVRRFADIPLLGVCLGHQIIASAFGAAVRRGQRPMHGQVTMIHAQRRGLFRHLARSFSVTRYHSLVVAESDFPSVLRVDARAEDGAIMAIAHRDRPAFGVQFHPEALLTENGYGLLSEFLALCGASRNNAAVPA